MELHLNSEKFDCQTATNQTAGPLAFRRRTLPRQFTYKETDT